MFRKFASDFSDINLGRETIFNKHPLDLASMLEQTFADGRDLPADVPASPPTQEPLGHPNHRSDVDPVLFDAPRGRIVTVSLTEKVRRGWEHLIYAYMIENTRIYEIFRRVLFELLHGEKLGTPLPDSQRWLRTTEALFYKDSTPFQITSVTSDIRKDPSGTARNAYQRMFGMDLNHGGEDGKPYPYVKAGAANGEFVATFEEFLREVWVGITYVTATSSSNPTDDSKISELAEKLHDMLRSRRPERKPVARGVRPRLHDVVVSHDGRIRLTDRHHPPRGGNRRGAAPLQDRRARRITRARPLQELLRHRRSDVTPAHRHRERAVQRPERGADALFEEDQ